MFAAQQLRKGMARLRSLGLQRALRTESEPPQFSDSAPWINPPRYFDKLSPSKAGPNARPLAPVRPKQVELLPACFGHTTESEKFVRYEVEALMFLHLNRI